MNTVKDSGKRVEFATGMVRDTQEGKPRFDLLDIPFLTRWAAHMAAGAVKYGEENWRKASTAEELTRFKASAFRHFIQWFVGETDEDHAAAIAFNVSAAEMVKGKLTPTTLGQPTCLCRNCKSGTCPPCNRGVHRYA
jgi:hypothetical protein